MKFKKIDALFIAIIILIAGLFFYKIGFTGEKKEGFEDRGALPGEEEKFDLQPLPPPSIIVPSRRVVEPVDEGAHFKSKLSVCREWWFFTAIFNNKSSELRNWSLTVGFSHMAYGDIFGKLKPDLFLLSLNDDKGNSYGGIINKERLFKKTLEASGPGVNLKYDKNWAEGSYPYWHVHVEDEEVDSEHEIIIDLDYIAQSLPLWTVMDRFKLENMPKSNIAHYMIPSCNVEGIVILDGEPYKVSGVGYYEHSWTPFYVRRGITPGIRLNGWDTFYIHFDNGWDMYLHKVYPAPQFISSKRAKLNPIGCIILSYNSGEKITEFRTFQMKPTGLERKILFVKMPSGFTVSASKKFNIILDKVDIKLDLKIDLLGICEKIWKFPSYIGMRAGSADVTGSISWFDGENEISTDLNGIATFWTVRAAP
jgi:predicted secreted hydrolase